MSTAQPKVPATSSQRRAQTTTSATEITSAKPPAVTRTPTSLAGGGGWRRLVWLAAAISVSLVLVACAPQPVKSSPTSPPEASTDAKYVIESLKSIDGVDDAKVALAVDGLPGNYSSTTTLTVTAGGDAALAEVLRRATSVIWEEYGTQLPQYRFRVRAPWPDGPRPLRLIVLKDRRAEFGFPQGQYVDANLILTKEELAVMFGPAE